MLWIVVRETDEELPPCNQENQMISSASMLYILFLMNDMIARGQREGMVLRCGLG
jgi:hypothetical protein